MVAQSWPFLYYYIFLKLFIVFCFFVYKYQTIIPVPLKKGFIQDQIQEDKRKFKGHEKFKSFRDKKTMNAGRK